MSAFGFSAALLAGGTSSRMGTDKAFLEVDGRPLWELQLEKLRALDPDQLMISANDGQQFETNTEVVIDEWPEKGPLGGLASCLAQCSTDRLLVVGVDMPRMTTDFLRMMATSGDAVVCRCDGLFQTLAAVYPIEIAAEACDRLECGDLSLQTLVRALVDRDSIRMIDLDESARALFENWNKPEDVHA